MAIGLCGLTEDAFARKSDQRFLFQSESFVEAHQALVGAVTAQSRVILFVGEPGTGKTTLLRYALRDFRAAGWACVLAKGGALKRLHELGSTSSVHSLAGDSLGGDSLTLGSAADARLILIIDDADDLPDVLLFNLLNERRIAGLTAANAILLAGSPLLHQRLTNIAGQEADVREIRLSPLSNDDVADYVRYRLRVVGQNANEVFSRLALDLVAAYSHGVPGRINRLCASAMILSDLEQRLPIDAGLLREAAVDALLISGEEQPESRMEVATEASRASVPVVVPRASHHFNEQGTGPRPLRIRRARDLLWWGIHSCRSLMGTIPRALFRLPRSVAGRLGIFGFGVALAGSAIWLHGVGYAPVCVLDEGQVEVATSAAPGRTADTAALWLPLRGDHIAQSASSAASTPVVPATPSVPFTNTESAPAVSPQTTLNAATRDAAPAETVERLNEDQAPKSIVEPLNAKPTEPSGGVTNKTSSNRSLMANSGTPPRATQRGAARREALVANKPPRVIAARPQHAKHGEEGAMLTADRSGSTLSAGSGWQVIRN